MATLRVLSKDNVSLYDHTSGASVAPAATAELSARSQWQTRDDTARLAVRNHLPLAELTHFGEHKTAKALDHFLARCPTELTVDLLEEHLLAAEKNIVTVGAALGAPHHPIFEGCSPSPLAPSFATAIAVAFIGAEFAGAVSAPSGRRRNGKGKGAKGSGGGTGGGGGVVVEEVEEEDVAEGLVAGVLVGVVASVAVVEAVAAVGVAVAVAAGAVVASAVAGLTSQQLVEVAAVAVGVEALALARDSSSSSVPRHPSSFYRCFSRLDDAWREEMGEEYERPRLHDLLKAGVDIFSLNFDAIISAMYAFEVSADGDCFLCMPPDPGIEAAALGASESALSGTAPAEALHTFTPELGIEAAALGASESALSGTAPAEALPTFTLDSGASRCFFRDRTHNTPCICCRLSG
ncbi:unnamed protein product [Closterium sp. Yama58-4]|nr:unnamed protein product [Closterium sp. Yama58-4]